MQARKDALKSVAAVGQKDLAEGARNYDTAFARASSTGCHSVGTPGPVVSVQALATVARPDNLTNKQYTASLQLRKDVPDAARLEQALKANDGGGVSYSDVSRIKCLGLQFWPQSNHGQTSQSCRPSGRALSSISGPDMTVVVTTSMAGQYAYAQLRLLFTCQPIAGGEQEIMALVRWYWVDGTTVGDCAVGDYAGCIALVWEDEPLPPGRRPAALAAGQQAVSRLGVIGLASVVRRVYVMPARLEEGRAQVLLYESLEVGQGG